MDEFVFQFPMNDIDPMLDLRNIQIEYKYFFKDEEYLLKIDFNAASELE
jgi:hypothetical protein